MSVGGIVLAFRPCRAFSIEICLSIDPILKVRTPRMLDLQLLTNVNGYIDGQWVGADSGDTTPVVNPATGETLALVPKMGGIETSRAIEAAERTLAQPTTIDQRRGWLNQLADLIVQHRQELGRIVTHEHGKPWAEAMGEADYAASFFRFYAGCIDHLIPRELPDRPRGHRWTVHSRPAGVAALVTPWNFPLAMLAKKFSAALAADCGCIIKPSSKTPLSMVALFSLMQSLNLPAGKANLLLGPPGPISDVLCQHPAVRVISFTGSTSVGKKLMTACAPHLKRLALELGGNAPFIVFANADVDKAIDHLMANKFRGSGQTCVCANRIYVQREIAEAFADKLATHAAALRVGNGMEDGVDMGPLIDQAAVAKVQDHVDDAIAKGATRIFGDPFAGDPSTMPTQRTSRFFPPTILRGVTSAMRCVTDETFGPLVPIIEFDNEDEVIQAANATEYGLAAYVFTSDDALAQRVIGRLSFGHVGYNTGSGPTAEAPFGGMKQSGFGREGGIEGLHDFIEPQSVPSPDE